MLSLSIYIHAIALLFLFFVLFFNPLGGLSSSTDGTPAVVRYTKDQRPTTLPIQPFTFQHQFQKSQKPLLPLLSEYVSHMQARGAAPPEGDEDEAAEEQRQQQHHHNHHQARPEAPTSVRPSPLGSYSPVRLQGVPSTANSCSTCSPSPDRCGSGSGSGASVSIGHGRPPRSLSCPISAGLLPTTLSHSPPPGTSTATTTAVAGAQHGTDAQARHGPLPPTPPPAQAVKKSPVPTGSMHGRTGGCLHRTNLPPLSALPSLPTSGTGTLGALERNQHEGIKNIMPGFGAARPANGRCHGSARKRVALSR